MMKNKKSMRDWQILSAYIDEQLSNRERARLETRLSKNPELKLALEEIRNLRSLLEQVPAKRAPRNFLLTPQMVGIQATQPRSIPVLRFASVLSTVLLMMVWFSNLVFPTAFGSLPRIAALGEQPEALLEVDVLPVDPIGDPVSDGTSSEDVSKAPPGILRIPDEESETTEEPGPQLEGIVLPEPMPTETASYKDETDGMDIFGQIEPGEIESAHSRLDAGLSDLDDGSEIRSLTIRENMVSQLSQWGILDFVMVGLAFLAVTTAFAAVYVQRKVS